MSDKIPTPEKMARMCVDVCGGIAQLERSEDSVVGGLAEELTNWRDEIRREQIERASSYEEWWRRAEEKLADVESLLESALEALRR